MISQVFRQTLWFESDPASQTGQTRAPALRSIAGNGGRMKADRIKINLVIRTIGAERGRAARGRPERQ
ncbi:hypothetical protein CEP88_05590 [Roseobacter denitrificans]|nr:hypothetical protein CEP88_05590 [Roseobacter denitrificans]